MSKLFVIGLLNLMLFSKSTTATTKEQWVDGIKALCKAFDEVTGLQQQAEVENEFASGSKNPHVIIYDAIKKKYNKPLTENYYYRSDSAKYAKLKEAISNYRNLDTVAGGCGECIEFDPLHDIMSGLNEDDQAWKKGIEQFCMDLDECTGLAVENTVNECVHAKPHYHDCIAEGLEKHYHPHIKNQNYYKDDESKKDQLREAIIKYKNVFNDQNVADSWSYPEYGEIEEILKNINKIPEEFKESSPSNTT